MKFEDSCKDWNVWNKNPNAERSILRLKKKLPEMECAKQLTNIVKNFYKKKNKILDFGCAAGHYYHSLKKIDPEINYWGFDQTSYYLKSAKKYFLNNNNVQFVKQSLFSMSKKFRNKFDIVFCCNVLGHLPSIDIPLRNLIFASKKYILIRDCFGENTSLCKFYYDDKVNSKGELCNFAYNNTYSTTYLIKKIKKIGEYKIEFIKDVFDPRKINKEFNKKNKSMNPGLTFCTNNIQVAAGKVIENKWVLITK